MTTNQVEVLKSLLYGYALLTVEFSDDKHSDKLWFKQAKQLCRRFTKRRPKPRSKRIQDRMKAIQKELVDLDADYFTDKDFSSYACMFKLLEYLVKEERDTEMRLWFGHWDYNKIAKELDLMMQAVSIDSDKYIGAVINKVKELR